jgi:hypothetical protein
VVTSTVAQKATGLAGGLSHAPTTPVRVARAGIQGGLPGAARQGVAEFKGLVTGTAQTAKENAQTSLRTNPLTGVPILYYETLTKGPVTARRNVLRAGTSAAFDVGVGAATYGAAGAVGTVARAGEAGAETATAQTAGAESSGALRAGEAGSFPELRARGAVGDDITPHHMPQAAAGYTSYGEGGALAMEQGEHALTRTYRARGAQTLKADADLTFRQVLAKDIWDVRSIVGSEYNSGLLDLIDYYRTNFPELMAKGGGQ